MIDELDQWNLGDNPQAIFLPSEVGTLFFGPSSYPLFPVAGLTTGRKLCDKLARDVLSSNCLRQRSKVAAFDFAFMTATEDTLLLVGLDEHMDKVEEIIVVLPGRGNSARESALLHFNSIRNR